MPGQETGGTLRQILTVAIFRSWRGSELSAAPGLPGLPQDTREMSHCQTRGEQTGWLVVQACRQARRRKWPRWS